MAEAISKFFLESPIYENILPLEDVSMTPKTKAIIILILSKYEELLRPDWKAVTIWWIKSLNMVIS